MGYPGLPRASITFLRGLAANNQKEWFEANRADYEIYWKAAALDLVSALGAFCEGCDPRLDATPKVGGALRRINRDVRFSSDKSPYAPMIHIALTVVGGARHSGMHLVIHPDRFSFGAGEYGLEPDALNRFRERVTDAQERQSLEAAAAQIEAAGGCWDEPDLKRVPNGYAADAAWDHLLRRKSVILRGDIPLPDWLFTDEAVAKLQTLITAHLPLLRWLRD